MGRMEQIIDEIQNYIEECKYQALSNTKIIVNKDELMEMLQELKEKTPDEIRRYQKIISNKEAILSDAQSKADAIIADAQIQTTELVNEHQIMQQAYAQANEVVMVATNQAQEILDTAMNEANAIRTAAMTYTDDILKNLENILMHSIDTSKARYDNLINSLQGCLDIVTVNRAELSPPEMEMASTPNNMQQEQQPETVQIQPESPV